MPDLTTHIGSLTLKNPLIAASGCFGYGVEYADTIYLSTLGAVCVKGLFLAEREGHVPPRIVETPAGMINAIGLQGIGVHRFVAERLARAACAARGRHGQHLRQLDRGYAEIARILSDAEGVAAIELNISCPNIKAGGIQFGCSVGGTHDVVSAVRKVTRLPIIPKLTPNVTDVASFARAAEEAGADAVSLVNTFLAMAIDIETRRPKLSNRTGGLSGPAIRPIAVRMIYECAKAVKIPVIGIGGITTAATRSSSSSRALPRCRSARPTSSTRSSGRSSSTASRAISRATTSSDWPIPPAAWSSGRSRPRPRPIRNPHEPASDRTRRHVECD